MRQDNSGASRQPRGPALNEIFARFPGHVVVAHDDLGLGAMASWQYHEVDGIPWALEAIYGRDASHLLVVKTVRPPVGLDPRGMPVESDAIQISNFVHHAEITATPERYGPGHEPGPRDHLERFRRAQQAVDQAQPQTMTVSCDGLALLGSRIIALDCCVARVTWDGSTIWCTGRPEIIGRVVLRTATVDDFRQADAE